MYAAFYYKQQEITKNPLQFTRKSPQLDIQVHHLQVLAFI